MQYFLYFFFIFFYYPGKLAYLKNQKSAQQQTISMHLRLHKVLKKISIAGAGIGGLTAAIRLAEAGYEVHVYEQKNEPGGKLAEIKENGYRFDAGPSLFTMPHFIDELLAGNVPFQYQRMGTLCHYFYEDGLRFQAPADQTAFISAAATTFGVEPKKIARHLAKSKFIYRITSPVFLERSLHRIGTYLNPKGLRGILNLPFIGISKSMHNANKDALNKSHLVQYFDRFATYNGSNPWKAPSTLNVIPHLEMGIGAFYPAGGMIAIPRALFARATQLGVHFHFGKKITAIKHQEGTITGIEIDHISQKTDLVVSNLDVRLTYQLLGLPLPKKIKQAEPSSSALIFYWGIRKTFPELHLHNILFSADYQDEFDGIFNRKEISKDPTIYINISSKMDKTDAPAGCENWFVMINVPANKGQDWEAFRQEARASVLAKISKQLGCDVESLIAFEEYLDPVRIEQFTGSSFGSLYGSSSNNLMSAFFRQANFTKNPKGLYFCGGSVHPGGGIPLCVLGGRIASDIIIGQHHAKH